MQQIDQELLVYNISTNKAMSLNQTAGFIWEKSDGKTSISEIQKSFNEHFSINVEEDFIKLTLGDLNKAGLLENTDNFLNEKLNRRKILLKCGTSMVMLPIILTIVAPTPSHAASSNCSDPSLACMSTPDCDPADFMPFPPECFTGTFCAVQCNTTTNCCFLKLQES